MSRRAWPQSRRRKEAIELLAFSVLLAVLFFGLGTLYLWQWDREMNRMEAPIVEPGCRSHCIGPGRP